MALDEKSPIEQAAQDEKKLQEAIWIADDCIRSADSDDGSEEWKVLNETVQNAWVARQGLQSFLDSIKKANDKVFGQQKMDWQRLNS